ncbi:MAG: O-methyltransferase [Bacteroidales bacterium]|jgi:caffeoyl-CoA O-methyltransferase
MIDKSNKNLACCNEATYNYAKNHSGTESELLKELDIVTNQRTLNPRMMIGHLQGAFFKFLTKLIKPKNILEIGTFTGYSTICFADALPEDGKIYTIDINPEWSFINNDFFERSGNNHKIISIIGDAMEVIPTLDISFDMVFIDGDKRNILKYYDLIMERVPSGCVILVDNVLWNGEIVQNPKQNIDSEIIDNFNKTVNDDPRTENVLLPVRDGIMVIRKK